MGFFNMTSSGNGYVIEGWTSSDNSISLGAGGELYKIEPLSLLALFLSLLYTKSQSAFWPSRIAGKLFFWDLQAKRPPLQFLLEFKGGVGRISREILSASIGRWCVPNRRFRRH